MAIMPQNNRFMERDDGVYQYVSWRITEGDVLYRDVWDHKPPLLYLWNLLAYSLHGSGSQTAIWALLAIVLILTTILIYFTLARIFSSSVAFLATLFLPLSLPGVQFFNTPEIYGLLFQVSIIALFLLEKPKLESIRLLLIGFLTALAFFTKQTTVGLPIVVGLWLVFDLLRKRKPWRIKAFGCQFFWLSVGFIIPTLAILTYFIANHSLADFWSASFVYNFGYMSTSLGRRLAGLIHGFILLIGTTGFSVFAFLGWVSAFWILIQRLHIEAINESCRYKERLLFLIFIGGLIENLLVNLSGNPYRHYYITLLPTSILAAALFFDELIQVGYKLKVQPTNLLVGFFSLFILSTQVFSPARYNYWPFNDQQINAEQAEVVAYIRANSELNEMVLMLGAESKYNFLTKRVSPTRYVYQYPLASKSYSKSSRVDEFINEVEDNKPRLIIDTHNEDIEVLQQYDPNFLYTIFESHFFVEHCRLQPNALKEVDWDVYRCN